MVLYQLEYQKRISIPGQEVAASLAPPVPVQHARAQLQGDRGAEPDLPVRKESGGNRETVGQVEVGGDPPEPRAPSHQRRGSEQGQPSPARIYDCPFRVLPQLGTLREPNPDNHGSVIPMLSVFAVD